MAFAFTQAQYDVIQTWLYNGPDPITHFSGAYTTIAGWMEGYPEMEPVRNWFLGAAQANAGQGPFSDLIRFYTERQCELRGVSLPAGMMQAASDQVAINALKDIFENRDAPLTLNRIAEQDARGVGQTIFFGNITDSAYSNNSAWSGAILFTPLGSDQTGLLIGSGDVVKMDTLDDIKNVLFACDAFNMALYKVIDKTLLGYYETSERWDAAVIGWHLPIDNKLDLLSIKKLTANTAAGSAIAYAVDSGLASTLDALRRAFDGTTDRDTTDSTFTGRANEFFSRFTAEQAQALRIQTLASFGGPSDWASIACQNTVDGEAVRNSLKFMSPLVVFREDGFSGRGLELYDKDTDQGSLTQEWITDRSEMLSGLIKKWTISDSQQVTDYSAKDGFDYQDFASGQEVLVLPDPFVAPQPLVHRVFFGSDGADTLEGHKGNDRLYGGGGADVLKGEAGHDYLEGGSGNDLLIGGKGNDTLVGGADNDRYEFSTGDGHDTLIDADGLGTLWINEVPYTLAQRLAPGTDSWHSKDGKVRFLLSGSDMLVLYGNGDSVRILNHQQGTLGLGLKESEAADMPVGANIVRGTLEHDRLDGTAGDDLILGVDGSDWVHNGLGSIGSLGGNDTIVGGAGSDRLFGGAGNDHIYAYEVGDYGPANPLPYGKGITGDWLDGRGGDDWMTGSNGQDGIFGGAGSDTIFGGGGDDIILADGVTSNLQSDLFLQVHSVAIGQDIQHIAYVSGAAGHAPLAQAGNDVVFAGEGNDFVDGYAGNDYIEGNGGHDYLHGGEGNDTLVGGTGNDTLIGDGFDGVAESMPSSRMPGDKHGDDLLIGGMGKDLIQGNGGHDRLFGDEGDDTLVGDDRTTPAQYHGNDYLDGGADNDMLLGMGGDDTLLGGGGDDWLAGEDHLNSDDVSSLTGNDWLYGGAGNDTLLGGNGNDYLDGGEDDDNLLGGAGNDTLLGGAGADYLFDEIGNNLFDGGSGDDTLEGGGGDDRYIFKQGYGVDVIKDTGGRNSIEFGSGFSAETISVNLVQTSSGEKVLQIANDGGDALLIFDYQNWAQSRFMFANGQTYSYSEFMRLLSTPLDLLGSALDDELIGGQGNDTLSGLGGADLLIGGRGNDTLLGGNGDDRYFFSLGDGVDFLKDDDGINSVIFDQGITRESLTFGQAYSAEGNHYLVVNYKGGKIYIENSMAGAISDFNFHDGSKLLLSEALTQAGGLTLFALDSGGQLFGSDADDILSGGLGNDFISAAAGNDHLYGNEGDDTLAGGAGDDRIAGGSGNDYLQGDAGNDTLIGGSGDDTLLGGEGNDTLSGEHGNDTLQGGAGIDTYLFTAGSGHDLIRDAEGEYSVLQLSRQILPDDLRRLREGDDLLIEYKDGSQSLRIESYYTGSMNWKVVDGEGRDQSMEEFIAEFSEAKEMDGAFWERKFKQQVEAAFSKKQERRGAVLEADGYYHQYYSYRYEERNHAVRVVFTEVLAGAEPVYALPEMNLYSIYMGGSYRSESSAVDRSVFNASAGANFTGGAGFTFVSADNLLRLFATQGSGFKTPGAYSPVYSSSNPDVFVGGVFGSGQSQSSGSGSGSGLQSATVSVTRYKSWEDTAYKVVTGDDQGAMYYVTPGNIIHGGAGNDLMKGFPSNGDIGVFLDGGNGQDTLLGTYSADYLIGGAGDDLLMGGGGADTYIFSSGDGVDVVNDFPLPSHPDLAGEGAYTYLETSESTQLDKIILPEGVSLNDMELSWGKVLAEVSFGKPEWFLSSDPDLAEERFYDGDFDESGMPRSRRAVSVCITLDIKLSETQTIRVVMPPSGSPAGSGIELYQFADGSVLSQRQLLDHFGLGDIPSISNEGHVLRAADNTITRAHDFLPLYGMDGNDTLYSGAGDERWDGGRGDDLFYGSQGSDTLIGGEGVDSYYFKSEDFLDPLTHTYIHDSDGLGAIYLDDIKIERSRLVAVGLNSWTAKDGSFSLQFDFFSNRLDILISQGQVTVNDYYPGMLGIDLLVMVPGSLVVEVEGGAPWEYFIPLIANENGDLPALTAARGNGEVLPSWLSFDPLSGRISGALERVELGEHIDITATYPDGSAEQYALFLYSNWNYLDGTEEADVLKGTERNDYIYAGSGDDHVSGAGGNDWIEAGEGNDTLNGGAGNDKLRGGKGNDYLLGGDGSDIYYFAAGDGRDTINNLSNTLDDSDILSIEGIARDNLWLSRQGDSLVIDVRGSEDRVIVQDWYANSAQRLDAIQAGGSTLYANQVDNLVSAMAAFGAPAGGEINLSQVQHDQLNAVIAANWQ
jgi:Ca2+-binding RTX toxin-like protein